MVKRRLDWLANHNFGHRDKRGHFHPWWWVRRLQCNVFGHEWFTRTSNWCAWCARFSGKYPKMRERRPENAQTIQVEIKRREEKDIEQRRIRGCSSDG